MSAASLPEASVRRAIIDVLTTYFDWRSDGLEIGESEAADIAGTILERARAAEAETPVTLTPETARNRPERPA